MSTGPTDPTTAPQDDQAVQGESAVPSSSSATQGSGPSVAKRPTLQQRFEESRFGRVIISAIIVVVLGTQAVWSMPDSAIKGGLMPIIEPANTIDLNQRWTMYAPHLPTRIEQLEIDVTMADGSTRIWKHLPNPLLEKIFVPDRWEMMVSTAVRQQDGRTEFARWVVDSITGPSDRPEKVQMILKFKVLAPPGQPSMGATQTKVLYEEVLTGRP